ncbi:MAG: hypothetical protein C4575_12975 [Desulforudis sp.]|jgi:hypothetical protein|nr:MAG: hypothetical protein C4575_12975 [Desulforudis sp.]
MRLTDQSYQQLPTSQFIKSAGKNCIAIAEISGTQTVAHNTVTIINYNDVIYDPWGAITTGAAWKFTCPNGKAGFFTFIAACRYNGFDWTAANQNSLLDCYINGVNHRRVALSFTQAAGFFAIFLKGDLLIYLNEDDYFDIRAYHIAGGTLTIPDVPSQIYIMVYRVGLL